MFYLIWHARYWSSVQIAISHQNQFSWQEVDGWGGWAISEVYALPWFLREKRAAHQPCHFVHNIQKKKKRCFPPSVGCNFLVSFKCFGAIRDCVKILQTFPQKQVYQPFKSTWHASLPLERIGVTEGIVYKFFYFFFTRAGRCLAVHLFVQPDRKL